MDLNKMDRKIEKKSWIERNLLLFSIGVVILFCLFYLLIFSDHSSKLNIEKDRITIEEVKQDVFQDYIAVIGTVEPIQTIYLDATEGGRVEEIFIREGTMVKKGDIIMRLSNDNLLLEISNNESEVARAINDLKTMAVNLENQKISNKNQLIDLYYDLLKLERQFTINKLLMKDKYISNEEFSVSKENYERNKQHYNILLQKSIQDSVFLKSRMAASEESVDRMQNNLNIIRNRLNKLIVKAPVDGELATLKPEIGEVINYGTRIGTINILDSYKLRVDIDEHYISRVKIQLNSECDFSAKDYMALITKIYPEVKDGRFAVDMVFTKEIPSDIRIGQTSRIRLELGESNKAILIARGSFYQNTGGQWIFVVEPNGNFATKRNIKLGRQNPNYYEVLEGLEVGERVITSGYENFGNVDRLVLK
jgi:HlyD family secretion protein